MKKLITISLMFILISSLVFALEQTNPFYSFSNGLFSEGSGSAYDNGWYDLTEGELKFCMNEIITDFQFQSEDEQTNYFASFFGTSATIQFEKQELVDLYLYEISGFVQPLDEDMDILIQYYDSETKEWVDVKSATATTIDGFAFYEPLYLYEDVYHARLLYGSYSLVAPAVNKTKTR